MALTPYQRAQKGLSELKQAVLELLASSQREGLKNSEIGRELGIYMGHKGHEGHVSRTLLAILEDEGTVVQNPETKLWRLAERSRE